MPQPQSTEIASLEATLAEVTALRDAFSPAAYTQIVAALNEKLQSLQIQPADRAATKTDEIRLVSVMFVDVADSTRIANELQHEWKILLGELQRRLVQVIETWDGEVGQYLGDGLLCFFGARRSRHDDPTRAVSCGLAIQQMARESSPDFLQRYRQDVDLRVAIATGRVVMGMVGAADKTEFTATGATANLAHRLQAACPLGEVVIDVQTYYIIRDHFVVQGHAPVELKGFEEPIRHFSVKEPRRPTTLPGGGHVGGSAMPFIGRERELRRFVKLANRARLEHEYHVITILGESGGGKSRLLQEALDTIDDGTYARLYMAAHKDKAGQAYNLLHDAVMDLCNLTDRLPPAEIEARLRRYFDEICPPEQSHTVAVTMARLAGLNIEAGPRRASVDPLAQVVVWLKGLARGKPLLIAVDNLHWADPYSLRLLEYIAHSPVDGLLVGAADPGFQRQNPDYMHSWSYYTEVTLNPLSDEATHRLLGMMLAHIDDLPDQLIDHIVERSGGNPQFIEEFMRMLDDSGVFEVDAAGNLRVNRRIYDTLTSRLPNGLLGVAQARLDDLPARTRRVAQSAAVLGHTFWEEAVSYLNDFDAFPLLNDLVENSILLPANDMDGGRAFSFRHTLFAEVAYTMLTRPDRESFHWRAAKWLEEHLAGQVDYLPDVAEHWLRAQQRERALTTYLIAVRERIGRGLYHEALLLAEKGLAAARDMPHILALTLESQLWLWRGQALFRLERHDEALAAVEIALQQMAELPPDQLTDARAMAQQLLNDAKNRRTGR